MKIAIIGAGKMGCWLASALAEGNEVALYDKTPAKAQKIAGVKPLQSLPELAAFAPELLVNAASLQNTVEAFEQSVPHLPEGCVIADVASVKNGLADYYKKSGRKFASMHPMFGPTFADFDSLREENAVIISESEPAIAEFFMKFFARLGVKTYEMSFMEHDKMMAYSLTTPFVSSLVFASCIDRTAVPGATFARHMKIAKGLLSEDDHLLCEILFNEQSVPQIEKISAKLQHLKHIIAGRDREEAKEFLDKLREKIG
ncbi:MAG: prephenate dehydrogenase/arogenate dehydrogenase family protein [Candidatus Micrarchaeia archaeon]